MAYADRDTSGSRLVAIFIVCIIVAGVGYAFVTGLAQDFTKKVAKDLNVFDVTPPPPPPPPDEPPPPPPDSKLPPPPVVSPPPLVRTNTPPPAITVVNTPPPVYIPTPTAPPPSPPAPVAPPAPPAPPRVSQAAGLKGDPGRFFGADAYPPAAQRAGAQGRVTARLSVGADGKVSDCAVTSSSGNSDLDETTCRIARRSVKFSPAKDASGAAMSTTYPLSVRWVLPQE